MPRAAVTVYLLMDERFVLLMAQDVNFNGVLLDWAVIWTSLAS